MTYDAIDIAKYIVQRFVDLGKPITHMKLQKLLYFSWMEYYKDHEEYLFSDEIYAWKFGPVVYKVYREFSIYGGMPITSARYSENEFPLIDKDVSKSLDKVIMKYCDTPTSSLVNQTHSYDSPWSKAYVKGRKDIVIDFKDIIEACNDSNNSVAR